jgi:hypothetical protein
MNTPAIATDLTRKFDLFAPVMLAPMADIAGGALAAAVSRAGGLGLIGGGYGNRDWLVKQFDIAGDAGVGGGLHKLVVGTQSRSAHNGAGAAPSRIVPLIRGFAPVCHNN